MTCPSVRTSLTLRSFSSQLLAKSILLSSLGWVWTMTLMTEQYLTSLLSLASLLSAELLEECLVKAFFLDLYQFLYSLLLKSSPRELVQTVVRALSPLGVSM